MKFSQAVKMAISSVRNSKFRSMLTMLGIIIGVMAVTLLISLVQGATETVVEEMSTLNGSNLTCTIIDRGNSKLSVTELEQMQGKGGIDRVAASSSTSGVAVVKNYKMDVQLYSVTEGYFDLKTVDLGEGRFLKSMDDEYQLQNCIIGHSVAQELFGDTDESPIGKTIRLNGMDFDIIGLVKENGENAMNSNDEKVFIPFVVGQKMAGKSGVDTFEASAQSDVQVQEAIDTLNSLLKGKFGADNYQILNMQEILDLASGVYDIMAYLLGGIACISLIVGGVGIMNIMLVSVTERTKEIGIRKAIGAQKSDIITQFLSEAIILCLMGAIIGVVFSFGAIQLINALVKQMHFELKSSIVVFAMIFTMVVGVVFGWYPANKAAKLSPIDALRFE